MEGLNLNIIDTVEISPDTAEELRKKAHVDPAHLICRGILIRSLTSLGVKIDPLSKKRKRGEGEEDTPEFETLINTHWKSALIDLLFYGTTLGYFVYTLTEVEEKKKDVLYIKKPFVLPITFYKVDIVTTNEYECFYGVQRLKPPPAPEQSGFTKYDNSLFFFPIPGYDPSREDGTFKSIVAGSFQGSKWIEQLYKAFVKAQLQRSHPPIVIQESATGKAAESNLLSLEALGTSLSGAIEDKKARDAEAQRDALEKTTTYYMSLGNQGKVIEQNPQSTSSTGDIFIQTTADNIFPLPNGYQMATPQAPLPEAQADLLNYNATRMREVCAMYGIPSSSVVSDAKSNSTTSTTSIDDNDNLALQRTLHFWQNVIISFLMEVYLRIRKDLNGVPDIKITVPIIPYTSTSKIHEFVDRNIISTEKGKEYVAAIAGLSPDDVLQGENEHKVPPIHGNENQITEVIRAKIRVMNAEAQERENNAKAIKEGEEAGEGDLELKDKEMELEGQKFENQMKLMDKQMQVEKIKTDAAMKKAEASIKVNKSAPKKTAG